MNLRSWRWWGLVAVVKAAGYFLAYRPWQLRWGATDEEAAAGMPGDELVPAPRWRATRAVTVAAPPALVWPWLVQMGAGRAGWYSYDRIDNGGVPSARGVRPELQSTRVGDRMRFTAGSEDAFVVERLEPERTLVLVHREGRDVVVATFTLTSLAEGRTRLVHRVQFGVRPSVRALPWMVAMDIGDFVMSRRMLLGVRARAEGRVGATHDVR
ncbi:MAG TPA: hypothetical protein VFZ64_13810 [Nocardioidaceae bacterium]